MTRTAGIDATLSEVVRAHERRGSAGDAHYGRPNLTMSPG
jgi:hypothetical protein